MLMKCLKYRITTSLLMLCLLCFAAQVYAGEYKPGRSGSSERIAQASPEMLYLGYIKKVRGVINDSFYKPVTEQTLAGGAFRAMKKVLPDVQIPKNAGWNTFDSLYISNCSGDPRKAAMVGEASLDGMVEALNDPYSVLLTPSKRAILEGGDGSGIGVEMGARKGKIVVIAPIAGSPAEKAGLKSGDQIVAIRGKSVRNYTLYNASMLITGKRGESIDITVERNGKPITVRPVFQPLKIEPVKYMMLSGNVGYIRIGIFTGKIFSEVQYAINYMKKNNAAGLILDVRNNPGGDFDEALKIAARFVPSGTLVWVVGKDGTPKAKSSGSNETFPAPVVILINEGSASASEVMTAAIGGNGKAVVMGRRSFGKGVVQTVYKLTGGAMLNLTTDKYLTPGKHDIHEIGITPQIILESTSQNPDPVKDKFVMEAWKYVKAGKDKAGSF
ncbi:MAG: S41 family peptidase [Firmicutes bacterium]|nr:S41 family peptidase [Bacillota bacterium]